jgi:hypothetical protein
MFLVIHAPDEKFPELVVLNKLVKPFEKFYLKFWIHLNSAVTPSFKAFCKKYNFLYRLAEFPSLPSF